MARKADPGKRDDIIKAAISVFAQQGYAGARVIEVARVAGVGKGTIYEYFRSKEDLFYATFEQLMAESQHEMLDLPIEDDSTAAERLSAIGDAFLSVWLPNLDIYGLVLEFWSATTALPSRIRFKDAFQSAYADFRKFMAAVIREGENRGEFAPVEAEHLASALIGCWDSLLLQAWLDPKFDALAASRTHMQVLIRGLSL